MATKTEIYRNQVAMVVGLQLRITLDEAQARIESHAPMIDNLCEGGLQFTQTAALIIDELKSA